MVDCTLYNGGDYQKIVFIGTKKLVLKPQETEAWMDVNWIGLFTCQAQATAELELKWYRKDELDDDELDDNEYDDMLYGDELKDDALKDDTNVLWRIF